MTAIEYLNQREVAEMAGVSRETIARWRYQGRMPKPDAYIGGTQGAWLEETIDEWMRSKTYGEWITVMKIREGDKP